MASPSIIDLASLLAPISGESPAGKDIRLDPSPASKYQLIKIARSAARDVERKIVDDSDTSAADEHWRKILSLAPEILTEQGKDLEVASWLTESLIRRHGFQGLRDGFKLIHGLIEQYWDNLFPMPDEDGLETRVAPLAGLSGHDSTGVLIPPIRKVPFTDGDYPGPYSLWQYQQALDVQRQPDEATRANKYERLGFTLEDIETAVANTDDVFFRNQLDDINEAIEACKRFTGLLDELCGSEHAPSTRNILNVLDECRGAISHLGKEKLAVLEEEETAEAPAVQEDGNNASAPGKTTETSPGIVNSREAAFKQLLVIAEFFRTTEPHSPVSYVLEKAVRWGNMPLNELIAELIPEATSRERYSELTGVKNEESND